jgi:hypothetical protein
MLVLATTAILAMLIALWGGLLPRHRRHRGLD